MHVPTDKKPARYYEIKDAVAKGWSKNRIIKELHVDFYTIQRYFPNAGGTVKGGGRLLKDLDPERYARIGEMVADGASLNEIMRSTGTDHRVIKRAFPNAGWGVRGGKGSAMVRKGIEVMDSAEIKKGGAG